MNNANLYENEVEEILELQIDEILNNLKFRTCTKCKVEKVLNGENFYYKNLKRGNEFDVWCKECKKTQVNEYRLNNNIEVKKRKKEYYENNKERLVAKQELYYCKNRDEILEKGKIERSAHYETYKKYRQSQKGKFKTYKDGARSRKLPFDLTFDDFCFYWQKPCYYCNSEIVTIGIDRVDNSKGYSINNCVPCCAQCNIAKSTMSTNEYIDLCVKVAITHKILKT